MAQTLDELIGAALALPRAERTVLVGRLRESLEEPDVPGGIVVRPQDLVEYGATYVFPASGRHQEDIVTLTATPGPTLSMSLASSPSPTRGSRRLRRRPAPSL